MERGVDYVTVEVRGLNQGAFDSIEKCQALLDERRVFKDFDAKVLNHRMGTGYIDVVLYPKNGDKDKFLKDIKRYGYAD